jgi:hypothetical protein
MVERGTLWVRDRFRDSESRGAIGARNRGEGCRDFNEFVRVDKVPAEPPTVFIHISITDEKITPAEKR